MTIDHSDALLAEAEKWSQKAYDVVFAMSGDAKWRMSIPPNEERDYDLIVLRLVTVSRQLLARCRQLETERKAAEARAAFHEGHHVTVERIREMHSFTMADRAHEAYKQGHDERCYICQLVSDLQAARAELAEKAADSRRLDWLDQLGFNDDESVDGWNLDMRDLCYGFDDLRAALDAAIAAASSTPSPHEDPQ